MYSTARRLSVLCAVLAAANILGLIMLIMCIFSSTRMEFYWIVTLLIYGISSTGISLFITICVRTMVQDLEVETVGQATLIKKLNDRVKTLENKTNL